MISRILFVDTETTGLDPDVHEIIELAVIECDPSLAPLNRHEFKVAPQNIETASAKALEVNGYSAEKWAAADARPIGDVLTPLRRVFHDAILCGHNVGFDRRFLEAAWKATGTRPRWVPYHMLDTVSLCLPLLMAGRVHSLKLGVVCAALGVEQPESHRALADAEASRRVAAKMLGPVQRALSAGQLMVAS